MIGLALAMVLAAPFPLPAIDGKTLAVTEGQKVFRLPLRFERAKQFYVEQLGKAEQVSFVSGMKDGARVLTIINRGEGESWRKAVVREGKSETVVEVTPVLRLEAEEISGTARPLVEFVIGRSAEVDKAVRNLDHAEQLRAK